MVVFHIDSRKKKNVVDFKVDWKPAKKRSRIEKKKLSNRLIAHANTKKLLLFIKLYAIREL